MKEIGTHPNIVTLLGVCNEQGRIDSKKDSEIDSKFYVKWTS